MLGKLITVEGIDGAGKSTQVKLLRDYLIQCGYTVLTTREPGGTVISEQIRAVLLDPANHQMSAQTEILLYAAARAQLIAEVIKPALAAGNVVICDRFIDSTLAYQGAGRGLALSDLWPVINLATTGLEPDLTLLLDLKPEIGKKRVFDDRVKVTGVVGDRLEQEDMEFYQRVQQAYLQLAQAYPQRIKLISADQPVEAVWVRVKQTVDQLLKL